MLNVHKQLDHYSYALPARTSPRSDGIAFFFFKLALRQGATPPTVLVCQVIGFASVSTIASVIMDRKFSASSTAIRYGVLWGVNQSIGFASLIEGLVQGEASILVPISQMSFVISAFIGILFFKENVTLRKSIGLVAAIGAVFLLVVAARS